MNVLINFRTVQATKFEKEDSSCHLYKRRAKIKIIYLRERELARIRTEN